ncbi:hypothetical protein SH2C18_13760 [Clostridium sediminicola]
MELSLAEMKEKVSQVKKALLEVTTIKKKIEKEAEVIEDKIKLLQKQAELSLEEEREDLAQGALEKKEILIQQKDRKRLEIEELQEKIMVINENKEKLEISINDFKIKKEELIAIDKAADAQMVAKEILTGISKDFNDITERIERAETKIKEKNARLAAMDELIEISELDNLDSMNTLEIELKNIQRREKIKNELKALKEKSKKEVN